MLKFKLSSSRLLLAPAVYPSFHWIWFSSHSHAKVWVHQILHYFQKRCTSFDASKHYLTSLIFCDKIGILLQNITGYSFCIGDQRILQLLRTFLPLNFDGLSYFTPFSCCFIYIYHIDTSTPKKGTIRQAFARTSRITSRCFLWWLVH